MAPLSTRVRFGYSVGSLVTGAFGTVPGLVLLPYLTDSLGVRAGLAGLLVLLPKAWDVVVNPVAGRISDRTRTRIGARRPYLLGAGCAVAVLFALIFAAPFGTGGLAAGYVAVTFVATATAYAFFQVPYVAMPAEMTEDYRERTRLMSWRVPVLSLAILVSGGLAPIVVRAGGQGLAGHRAMGLFVGLLIAVGAVGAFAGTRRAPLGEHGPSEPTLRGQLSVARRNRPFMALLACWVVQSVGVAIMLAGVNYYAEQVLRSQAAKTLLFVCFVGPAILVTPVWSRVADRAGKLPGYVMASLLFAAGALLLALARQAPYAYLATALVGAGYAGKQVFGLAMLPDCVAVDARRTGRRQAGVFTGVWTAGETLGFALGPGILGLVLQLSGYTSSASGTSAVQGGLARTGILLGGAVLPGVTVALALLFLRGYDLTESRLRACLEAASPHRPLGKMSSVRGHDDDSGAGDKSVW